MNKKIIGSVLLIMLILSLTLQSNTIFTKTNDIVLASTNSTTPKYIFYFIGDGLGTSQRQLTEYYLQEITSDKTKKLTMNMLPHTAINTTHSLDTLVTDSAAAGTALATGHKTNNGVISKDVEGNNLKTLIEGAREKGMATGLVSTTRITHATPAVFASHNESRGNENEIAVDYLDSGIDYIVGGGVRHFLPNGFTDFQKDAFGGEINSKRKDDRNLLAEFREAGYEVRYGEKGAEEFQTDILNKGDKYVNLFTTSHLPYTIDDDNNTKYDVPSLADITNKGIDLLSQDKDGFFFMIEGGRIDHASHPNDPSGTIMDTLAFDKAIEEAYKFYLKYPQDTLIVVVGDHETGGLGMGVNTDYFLNLQVLENAKMSIEEFQGSYTGDREAYYKLIGEKFGLNNLTEEEKAIIEKGMDMVDKGIVDPGNAYKYDEAAMAVTHMLSERAGIYWTSYAHTATQIPMSAIGVGAEKFNGFLDNTDIAKITARLAKIELN